MANIAMTPTKAKSDDDANKKFQQYRSLDPFPDIPPALLNSADFIDYILVTGMIYPFDPLKQKVIKSASLELDIANEVLYWDEKGKRTYKPEKTKKNETIVFRKNSITFVTVNTMFRLPDYIALRFNLQIHHVHRGLLLGTGPLVDPGFQGALMIPIHNLTENDYELDPYDGLICVEFTKLSPNQNWENSVGSPFNRAGKFKSNEGKKDKKNFLELMKMHVPQQRVQSSLDSTLVSAQKATENLKGRLNLISIASVVVIVGIIFQVFSLINDTNKYIADAKNTYMDQLNKSENSIVLDINKADYEKIKTSLEEQKKEYDSRIRMLEMDIFLLKQKISSQKRS